MASQVMDVEMFPQEPELLLSKVIEIKNAVIGNRGQKERQVMQNKIIPRLLQFMSDNSTPIELKIESAVVLGSLAKGPESIVQNVLEAGTLPVLLQDVMHTNIKYAEACLSCLRTLVCRPSAKYLDTIFDSSVLVPHLISIMNRTPCTQESVPTILAKCCTTAEHQAILCNNGAVPALASLLSRDIYKVQMPVLQCLAVMSYKNYKSSTYIASATCNGDPITEVLVRMLARNHTTEMQMSAAKCLSYMMRAGAIDSADPIISQKALSTLVRMCKPDKTWEQRVDGAETLGYLIEVDVKLQYLASISDHIISTLAEYFKFPGSPPDFALMPSAKDDYIIVGNELRQAAFRAYASLCANDEDIRKKVIDTKNLLAHIVNGLSDPVTKVQVAAVRCLHSLSRSVQQLRTSFHDHEVWKAIMLILPNTADETLLCAVSAIVCNLLLEFSPSKEHILKDLGTISVLVNLTNSSNPQLRLNGIWALMNLTFHADQSHKEQVINTLGSDGLFRLLSTPEVDILMKTLGLLRNLLSSKPHIDKMMSVHGTRIMQAVTLVLDGSHPIAVTEQALCILMNVANGNLSKNEIMNNEDILNRIIHFMQSTIPNSFKLQIAATLCVTNLARNGEEGAAERQSKLVDLGVQKILQQLVSTNDSDLFDCVKVALQQF